MAIKIKRGDLVYYRDEPDKDPFIVWDVKGKQVSLNIRGYPDIEQDFYISVKKIKKFPKNELAQAKKKLERMGV